MTIASLDKEAHKYKVMGMRPSKKKIHLKKGALRIAKKIRTMENSRLKILPIYNNDKGESLNIFPMNMPKAWGK